MPGPTRWKEGFVHVDDFSRIGLGGGTFSGNVYLELNDRTEDEDKQHHLEIWDVDLSSHPPFVEDPSLRECLVAQDPRSQFRLRKALPPPLKIEVNPGDLVLLCTQRPHAVRGFESGMRISYQSFIEFRGESEGLVIDS